VEQTVASSQITTAHDWREARGRQLASAARIRAYSGGHRFSVPSATGAGSYVVDLIAKSCTCPDHELRGAKCKHQHAVEFTIVWEQSVGADGSVTQTVAVRRKTYPQDWPAYNAAQAVEKERVEVLLRGLCDGIVEPVQKIGRPRIPLRDAVFAAVHKVYTTMSGRRAQSDARACLERGLVAWAPHYNSVFRTLESPAVTLILRALVEESALPLREVERDFSQDSTGFSTVVYDRWFDEKHGKMRADHPWVKLHALTGNKTNVIAWAMVSDSGDCPLLVPALEHTAKWFQIDAVACDKAYLARYNVEAICAVGAVPYIPFKENSTGAGPENWRRMWSQFMLDRPKFLDHYHRRSNVESTFWMVKSKFGGSVRSKLPVAQANEVYAKLVCHNLAVLVSAMHELGVEPTFWRTAPLAEGLS